MYNVLQLDYCSKITQIGYFYNTQNLFLYFFFFLVFLLISFKWARLIILVGRFRPGGLMFDTPALDCS